MKVLKENLSEIVVLTLKGEFDSFVTNPFSSEIQKVIDSGVCKIVLNMRLVKFINSTALGSMIKARKLCKKANGDMAVSQPSPAVREAMESLGLDRLFSIYDDDEDAVGALDKAAAVALTEDAESTVMIHIPGQSKPVVARLRKLLAETIECRVPTGTSDMVAGRELRLKFRLPLYRKEFFDISARIETVAEEANGIMACMRYTKVSDEDRAAIERFLDDMDDLREAARGAT
jgi:anti-anti-sigma factor